MEYLTHIVFLIATYSVVVMSLVLVTGHAGLLSISHAALFGIGAYTSAILTASGWPFWTSILACLLVLATIGGMIGMAASRVGGDYFAVVTFSLQIICVDIFRNWTAVTGGPLGISNIQPPRLFGLQINTIYGYCAVSIILASLSYLAVQAILTSPYGRVLRAIRGDERLAITLGKNIFSTKVSAFIISSLLTGIAGAVYASYITYIGPESFGIMKSVFFLSVVILGGSDSIKGGIIACIVLVALPEVLRLLPVSNQVVASINRIVYGMLIVAVISIQPKGIMGDIKL